MISRPSEPGTAGEGTAATVKGGTWEAACRQQMGRCFRVSSGRNLHTKCSSALSEKFSFERRKSKLFGKFGSQANWIQKNRSILRKVVLMLKAEHFKRVCHEVKSDNLIS